MLIMALAMQKPVYKVYRNIININNRLNLSIDILNINNKRTWTGIKEEDWQHKNLVEVFNFNLYTTGTSLD